MFPTQRTRPESDGTTRTILDLVQRFVAEDTRIIHVLVDPNNQWMFEGMKSTGIIESLEVLALVQECQDVHAATVVQQLLLNTQGANPQTVFPKAIVGWTWSDLQGNIVEAGRRLGTPVNPLAIIKNGLPDASPAADTPIEAGDEILVAAVARIKWEAVEKRLLDVRSGAESR